MDIVQPLQKKEVELQCEKKKNEFQVSLVAQWNPPGNAGDMGSIPDPGTSHTLQGN